MNIPRRGVILPVVLFVLLLVGLLGGMFAFHVHADLASTHAVALRMQTRLAAETGVERVKMLLRASRFDVPRWYNNPDELHRIIVWGHDADARLWGTHEEFGDRDMVYRFSIVADDPTDDEHYIRYGITDESSKLHLNAATEEQLLTLVSAVIDDDTRNNPQEIVDAILDWRDADATPRGEAGDAEGEYYRRLDKPYRVKNGPFDTVEELLLVKGVSARLLYGEDFDRNGLLTANEDDGDLLFPPDNQDGILNPGLFPYLTVLSRETNVSNDNRPRIYLLGDETAVQAQLTELFPDEAQVVNFIVSVMHPKPAGQGGAGGGKGGQGSQDVQGGAAGGAPSPGGSGTGVPPGRDGQQPPRSGQPIGGMDGTDNPGGTPPAQPGSPPPSPGNAGANRGGGKPGPRQQRVDPSPAPGDPLPPTTAPSDATTGDQPTSGQVDSTVKTGEADRGSGDGGTSGGGGGTGPPSQPGSGDGGSGVGSIKTPAALLLNQLVDGQPTPSPLGAQHLAALLDRTTVISPQKREIPGLVNINTASPQVLRCLKELTEEQIGMIVELRPTLDEETKATPAWLVTEEVMDVAAFVKVAPQLAARGQQFTIESLGYADHVGMVSRLQVVVDMEGPIAKTIYYRDLTQLGGHYPIRKEDGERVRVR